MTVLNRNAAVIGSFFGDEAKARVIHWMAKDYKYIVRFSGSSNAGHTLYHKGQKIVRHLLPSADFSLKEQVAVLAAGMVINPNELLQEVKDTEAMFPGAAARIIVDPDAFVISPDHLTEDKANVIAFGSTGKGVSVAYRDKIYRKGTKIRDLIKDNNEVIAELKKLGVQFKYNLELYNEFSTAPIMFEGAQSVLLDINFGTYPFVTSGECTPAGIFNSGFSYAMPGKVFGIAKAYSTRVGDGPFPTELDGVAAEELRKLGNEYGATTGRPRRVGWLDLPALNYAIKKSGINSLIITKLDVLNGMKKIPLCHKYATPPVCAGDFFEAKPEYIDVPGWMDAKKVCDVQEFLDKVEQLTGVEVTYISCGTAEEDILYV